MMISKIIKDFDSDMLIITWDVSKKTFRTDLYKDYKGNRKSAPDEFKIQVKVLQKLIEKFNIPQVSVEGYEADDVLGTLSKSFNDNNEEVLIVTGDRDSFQLIGDKTNVLYTKRGISEVERFGNRTISGFLRMVGAEMPMPSDQVIWSEQNRLHISYDSCTLTGVDTIDIPNPF